MNDCAASTANFDVVLCCRKMIVNGLLPSNFSDFDLNNMALTSVVVVVTKGMVIAHRVPSFDHNHNLLGSA